jgi:hypothetical protein
MTAADEPELIDAAAQAIAQGTATAQAYHSAAASNPGMGAEVRLPSTPGTVGLSYDTAPEPAPMPGRPSMKLVPHYASPAVSGDLHYGAPVARSSDAALSSMTFTSLPPVWRSSMTCAPASESWPKRFAAALKRMFNRS